MKTSRLLRSLLLVSALTSLAAHAADPQPPTAVSEADIKTLLALLNKIVAQSAVETDAAAAESEEPAPPPAPAAPAAKTSAPTARPPLSTALKTGGLGTSSLAPSGGLEGRGPGALVRMTEEAWRLLFPVKPAGN